MALETAAGVIALNEDLLATTLANCTTVQTFLGAANATEALARIYFGALDQPADGADAHTAAELASLRPFVLLWTDEQAGIQLDFSSLGGADGWHLRPTRGVITCRFEVAAGSGTPQEEERIVKNAVGKMAQSGDNANPGLVELAGRPGYMAISRLVIRGPWRSDEDEVPHIGDFWAARFDVEWGIAQR